MSDARWTAAAWRAAAALAAAALLAPAGLAAQEGHVLTAEELDRAAGGAVEEAEADRRAVLDVLERSRVREAAEGLGLELVQAREAVATLDGEELARLAERAREVDDALAGGNDTITISATTLIIILLVLLIILVAD